MSQSLQGQDPWSIPLVPPPPGISSNFHKQSPLTGLSVGIIVGVFTLMISTLSLRFWTKYKSKEAWHLDDSFTILTFALTIAVATLQFYVTEYFGFNAWDIPVGLMMTSWTHNILRAAVCTTLVMLFFGKCCILAFYLRMFGHLQIVRYQIYGAFGFAFAVIVASILLPVWVQAMWRAGTAILHTANLTIAIGIIKLVLDLVIVYIPIPVVVGMKLSWGKKVGVLATFLTGAIAIVADIIDVYFRVKVYQGKGTFINGVYVCLCGLVEAGISVIVASMPAAAKAWKRHVMTSSLYKMMTARRSKFNVQISHQLPSDLRAAKAEVQRKRKWGLYSIPSLLMSHRSEVRTSPQDCAGDGIVTRSEMTMVREFRQSLEGKFPSLDGSSLELRDPSDLDGRQSIV